MKELQIAQVVSRYYEKGMTQQEIAYKFYLSKMTVSRMLQKARELGIVKVGIKRPFQLNEKLQRQIEREYGLKKAIVVKQTNSKKNDISKLVGRVWAFYMNLSLPDDYIFGIGGGKTVAQVVRNLTVMKTKNVHIVQLMGGLTDVAEINPFTIVEETCRKLGAKGTYFTSYAVVESKEVRDSIIYNSPMGSQVRSMWNKCNQVLFGIGAIEKGTLLSAKLVSAKKLREIRRLGAVGDVLGHCFDENGNFIKTDLEERLVSIPIKTLKSVPERIAVVGGEYKVQAIRGLLRSGLITTLVTDETAAKKIMES